MICCLSFFRAFGELLKLSREYQMLTVTKLLSVDAEPTSEVEQHILVVGR
uniref:Uncharacterized protein n=1 Tax=Utricularia reniformis TaxID=192314 RepID=A0A1Y0AZE0_9LAMI|nr:hypothetical protein AEK19_MT0230 [Utricularia reniformis]ART30510.1 hypothetical protein AEK19_MT0230 [Utricularia reniformis]